MKLDGNRDRRNPRAGRLAAFAVSAVVLTGLPTAVLAVTDTFVSRPSITRLGLFTPANGDPAIARRVAAKIAARGQAMRFTPAGATLEAGRTVTVAIRVDPEQARAISVRGAIAAAKGDTGLGPSLATLAPARYNLGISRGYQSFAKTAEPTIDLKRVEMIDLASFRPREGVKETPGRLQPRIALEEASRAGSSPRTLQGAGEQAVDLGAGYRLSRNLNVTAGVRLSQDRDRLAPLTDAVRDDQAVYVGTQFRF
ncbi:hypothetical protein ACWPM1_02070 [Tsuneonella sp. HG249]